MSAKMHVDDFKDAVQVLDAGAASHATLSKTLQRRMAKDWRRARASEAEQEKRLQTAGDALERARDTLLGIVHGAPLSTVQGGLAEVRSALVALGRKP